jgi:uncharacterized protein (TIGR02594 family)
MENVIVDVLIGLVLIYAAFSLLVTSVQELVSGQWLRGRVSVLHRLLNEATGQDPKLKERLLKNPLVFALSEGEEAREGTLLLRPPRGPSEVPADVFARALLMEVDAAAGGKHPSERFATPQQFIDALTAKGGDKPEGLDKGIVGALRGLMVGNEANWRGFEAAIAAWFTYIGDRSNGWFKRRSATFTFFIALFLAVALNIDTMYVARSLGSDGELRGSLVSIAERVVAQRDAGTSSEPPVAAKAPDKPAVLVKSRLEDAYSRLRPVYERDDAIARFEHRLTKVADACPTFPSTDLSDPKEEPKDAKKKSARDAGDAKNASARDSKLSEKFVSDAHTWVEIIPVVNKDIQLAVAGVPDKSKTNGSVSEGEKAYEKKLYEAYQCLVYVSAWVSAATTVSKDPATQREMQEASRALEDSKFALLELARQHTPPRGLLRLFQMAPDDFKNCTQTARSLSEVRICTEEQQGTVARLPIGLSLSNLRQQLCSAKSGPRLDKLKMEIHQETGLGNLCAGEVKERPEIGLSAMLLTSAGVYAWIALLAGVLVTTLFALLGAPFWFDLLGKFVHFRAAGRASDLEDNAKKATGTLPLLPPPSSPSGEATPPTPQRGAAPTNPSLNRFEDQLTTREIIALQQRLDVMPASGSFDVPTRARLKDVLGSDVALTPTSYLQLVGRPAIASETLVVGAVGHPTLHLPHPNVQALATNLMAMLQFPGRIATTEGTFSDDLRALCVLYRYKNVVPTLGTKSAVFELARNKPAVLDEIDNAMMTEILSSRAPKPQWNRDPSAPWLDWALGELGQVEKNANNRKASNPRICEYLDAIAAHFGDQGDKTPWCGAFVTWVVTQHNKNLPSGHTALPPPPKDPGWAGNWSNWGRDFKSSPQAGDVIVVNTSASGSGHHVGWCFAIDATHVFLLGGNQTEGGRVCLSTFLRTSLHAARRG